MNISRPILTGLFSVLASMLLSSTSANAVSFQLETLGNEPFYQSVLTKAVYQNTRSNALQDLTISNAAGEQVPYALIPYEALHRKTTSSQDRKKLILFPIKESALTSPNLLRIQLERNVGDTKLNVIASDTSNKVDTVYLVDAENKHAPLQTLVVDWHGSEGKLLTVEILTSDDLEHWSHAGSAVLLKTATASNSILQNTITLDNATEARYLQIRPTEASSKDFYLTQVNAEYSNLLAITPNLLWQNINFIERTQNAKTGQINLYFESLGHFPASHLRLHLPQDNTATTVTIKIRSNSNEEWSYLTTASTYRLIQKGHTFTSPDVLITPTVARYWRLEFNQSSGGIGAENPTLSLGWLPPTIVWNARGQTPFSLHVGESPNIINRVDIASLIPDYKLEKLQDIAKAGLSTEVSTNIEGDVNPWLAPIDYRRWLLWGGLLLGVLILAGMAFSLLKSQNIE